MKFLLIVAALLFVVASVAECKPADGEAPAEVAETKTEGQEGDSSSNSSDDSSNSSSDEGDKIKEGEAAVDAIAAPAVSRKRRDVADNTLSNLQSAFNAHQDLLAAVAVY